jgi:DNA-binding NtrC family response regulator
MPPRSLASTIARARTGGDAVEPDHGVVHVVHPPPLRQRFRLGRAETVIGRESGPSGLSLDDGTVSRRHALVGWNAARGAHAFADCGSRNGSFVDGVAVGETPRALVDGSVLRVGDVLLVYERSSADDDPEGPAGSPTLAAAPGAAASMVHLRAQLARAAVDPAPVLIIGETGTGKEKIAQELHRLSGRPGRFVALNCAALNPQLVESQLFGHGKGAFTGATEASLGLFRAAQDGTLFLDEIGELALELQPKLLRALQEREIMPLGSTQAVRVDARVVAATHRDLAAASESGDFRQDLYARLSLWELQVPALRERRVDLFGWIDRLQKHWAEQRGVAPVALRFDADASEALLRFSWPLNLRGLDRLVHELGTSAEAGNAIRRAQLPRWLGRAAAGPAASAQEQPSELPSRAEFTAAFEQLAGSVHGLAKRFGRDRRQIYRWMEAYDLKERRGDLPKKTR